MKKATMEKATINIEVVAHENGYVDFESRLEGNIYLLMKGLTDAIKGLEESLTEEDRADFRIRILNMLNDRE